MYTFSIVFSKQWEYNSRRYYRWFCNILCSW